MTTEDKKQQVIALKNRINVTNCKPCSECRHFKKDDDKDALTVGNLCTLDSELNFRVEPSQTCDLWSFESE